MTSPDLLVPEALEDLEERPNCNLFPCLALLVPVHKTVCLVHDGLCHCGTASSPLKFMTFWGDETQASKPRLFFCCSKRQQNIKWEVHLSALVATTGSIFATPCSLLLVSYKAIQL